MEVYPDMRKIKRWKQGIAVAGVIALTGSLFAGCGGADGKIPEAKEKQEAAIRQEMQIQQIL
ncbi:hypothetical protein DW955_20625 [Ruminococcus sp. AM45-9BH]|nr:hypothetical protein DW955_20625 [Ruminococcus sp. AM45-9BH]